MSAHQLWRQISLADPLTSLDGEVKLWDIRGGDRAIQSWDMCPQGLSAFDVHDQAEVFAA